MEPPTHQSATTRLLFSVSTPRTVPRRGGGLLLAHKIRPQASFLPAKCDKTVKRVPAVDRRWPRLAQEAKVNASACVAQLPHSRDEFGSQLGCVPASTPPPQPCYDAILPDVEIKKHPELVPRRAAPSPTRYEYTYAIASSAPLSW